MILYAGPPFVTDDPEIVDYKHWEFYIASNESFSQNETDMTLPHIEINYGVIREIQFHIILPMEYSRTPGSSNYGFSKTELGIKYRFLEESESSPQVGVFPLVELPTEVNNPGSKDKTTQVFLPVWLQKSWGDFTTFGGCGYWLNPGEDRKNWMLLGWEAQYNFSETFTFGGEVYYQTADETNSKSSTLFNLGGYINFSDRDHFLFSVGHNLSGDNVITGYIAYQLTI